MEKHLVKIDTVYLVQKVQPKVSGDTNIITILHDLSPLIQNLSWIIFISFLIYIFRIELQTLRESFIDRLKKGSSIKLGIIELGEKVEEVKNDLENTNQKISRLFITTMGINLYANLKKIKDGNFGPFQKSEGLKRELYYLRDMGYIEVPSISGIPGSGLNLSEHLAITPLGKEFVELREEILKDAKSK
ncbi:MAG: hypothetical protein JWQ57_5127 [Mucilaginibacter sp.]|nr:hypothetical protein [Mucilaginibacter sp.]